MYNMLVRASYIDPNPRVSIYISRNWAIKFRVQTKRQILHVELDTINGINLCKKAINTYKSVLNISLEHIYDHPPDILRLHLVELIPNSVIQNKIYIRFQIEKLKVSRLEGYRRHWQKLMWQTVQLQQKLSNFKFFSTTVPNYRICKPKFVKPPMLTTKTY